VAQVSLFETWATHLTSGNGNYNAIPSALN
jgi:hypothetical protein